jgi:hypothetical protein
MCSVYRIILIVLFVILRFTADYPFDIFKLFSIKFYAGKKDMQVKID